MIVYYDRHVKIRCTMNEKTMKTNYQLKILLLYLIQWWIIGSVSAQYQMDLSNIPTSKISYLKMGHPGPKGEEIRINSLYWEKGGVPQIPVMGEFHYVRMDERYWRDALLKMKASGINIVSTYVLWSVHEELEGQQIWNGNRNLRNFVRLCNDLGLLVHLRIGPYCNAEIVHGGLPDWIVRDKRFRIRSNDPLYLEYVKRWYASIYEQVKGMLYKDGGPIYAIQLENEYVTKGMVVSHLMNLKNIALDCGFDLPLYTMTHWMQSDYPKGEIVPYAGFYIERPWVVNGKEETPSTPFEFFTYNRLANDIGTNKISTVGGIESLDYSNNESPFFTCEVGVGTTNFYNRRAVVPEEMAGANITLRLGCGVNLMGYYMYVGGTNPIGQIGIFGEEPEFCYDYQAPIREFGTLGVVMNETKKMNYFMNDFGSHLATQIAYLPSENNKYENLQWAVRTDGNSGFLFCSNYLYKHDRPDFKNVRFSVKLKNETISFPKNEITVRNGSYFIWPFNLVLQDCILKYATVQPICKLSDKDVSTYFFYADDGIQPEYLFQKDHIKKFRVQNAEYRKTESGYFVDQLHPGKSCVLEIIQDNGHKIRVITLTEKESDEIWHLKDEEKGIDVVALSKSSVVLDDDDICLTDTLPDQQIDFYHQHKGKFVTRMFSTSRKKMPDWKWIEKHPMREAKWISAPNDTLIQKSFLFCSLSDIRSATLRYQSMKPVICLVNGQRMVSEELEEYNKVDIASACKHGNNLVQFISSEKDNPILAEIEIILKNGSRLFWRTDNTWTGADSSQPVIVFEKAVYPQNYAHEEHLVEYELSLPGLSDFEEETRLYIDFVGDVARVYINDKQVNDYYYNGAEWILGVSRYCGLLEQTPLIIKIKGFKTGDEQIYLERHIDRKKCIHPKIVHMEWKTDYRFSMNYFELIE